VAVRVAPTDPVDLINLDVVLTALVVGGDVLATLIHVPATVGVGKIIRQEQLPLGDAGLNGTGRRRCATAGSRSRGRALLLKSVPEAAANDQNPHDHQHCQATNTDPQAGSALLLGRCILWRRGNARPHPHRRSRSGRRWRWRRTGRPGRHLPWRGWHARWPLHRWRWCGGLAGRGHGLAAGAAKARGGLQRRATVGTVSGSAHGVASSAGRSHWW